jgi:hypothetical protein
MAKGSLPTTKETSASAEKRQSKRLEKAVALEKVKEKKGKREKIKEKVHQGCRE